MVATVDEDTSPRHALPLVVEIRLASHVRARTVLSGIGKSDWLQSLNLKFLGYVRTTKSAVPYLKERRWGRIINVIGNDALAYQEEPFIR